MAEWRALNGGPLDPDYGDRQRLLSRIMAEVNAMPDAPPLPLEARRYYQSGAARIGSGTPTHDDLWRSMGEFRAALHVAPWLAEAYHALGMTAKEAERFDEAVEALEWYLVSRNAVDRSAVRDTIERIKETFQALKPFITDGRWSVSQAPGRGATLFSVWLALSEDNIDLLDRELLYGIGTFGVQTGGAPISMCTLRDRGERLECRPDLVLYRLPLGDHSTWR